MVRVQAWQPAINYQYIEKSVRFFGLEKPGNKEICSFTIFDIISFILFIFYSKERNDIDGLDLNRSVRQSDIDFNAGLKVFQEQLEKRIDLNDFYSSIEKLADDTSRRVENLELNEKKEVPDYYFELFQFMILLSFWFLFFSTRDWCSGYLYLGSVILFCITNNQYGFVYKIVRLYSKFVNKIFPIKKIDI